MTQRITDCFLGTDLRCQHAGLAKLAAKRKIDVSKIKPGSHIIFINNAMNKLKMYSSGEIVSYLKLSKGTLDLDAIAKIPQAYGDNIRMKYNSALRRTLLQKLKK